jgi:rhamnosyl/mannosyltransferase
MGWRLFQLYREHAQWADVIHIHYPWPFADLVHLLSGVCKPVVVTYHSDIIRQRTLERFYSPLRTRFFKRVSATVATSPNYMQSSLFLNTLPGKKDIIPLGLDPQSYAAADTETLADVERQFGHDYFLFIGVLRYYKGLHTLLEAAGRNGLKVVIAGSGPEEASLKAQALEMELSNVHFTGFVTDDVKAALLANCRAVVFPSCVRSEAFGVTLLEGQLYSKPLITCEIGTGTSFVNLADKTGLVVPPEDPMALALAMRRLDLDTSFAQELGNAGRQRLETYFSGTQVGQSYYQLYQKLAEA